MARRIVITSGKGGAGKTTITAFLGAKLAEMGKRVVLLDMDFGLNNLDVTCGVEDKVVYDITDVTLGRCRVRQALIECEQKNLFMLPCAHTFCRDVSAQSVKLLIEGLSSAFDFVLVDCPAGVDFAFERAVATANEAIVVVNPTLQSVRDADKVVSLLKSYKMEGVSVVINRARKDLEKRNLCLQQQDVQNLLKVNIIAKIYESDTILLSKNYILPSLSASNKEYKSLAKRVVENKYGARDYASIYGGLFTTDNRRK